MCDLTSFARAANYEDDLDMRMRESLMEDHLRDCMNI